MMLSISEVSLCFPRVALSAVRRLRSTVAAVADTASVDPEWASAKPYTEIPGPKPLPIPKYGNFWRMIPGIGRYGNMGLTDFQKQLMLDFGPIAKLAGMGRDEIIFIYNPEDAQKVYRTEGVWPIRKGLDSMDYYRSNYRQDVFGKTRGLVSTQGKEWQENRTAINQPMMKPANVRLYIHPIEEVTEDFITRMKELRDENMEMPADFANELNKWSLESISYIALDTRLGCLDAQLKADSEAQIMIDTVDELFKLMYKLDILPSLWPLYNTRNWKKYLKVMDTIIATCSKHINKKLTEIQNKGEDNVEGQSILERLLKSDGGVDLARLLAMDMMTAGIDTTSNASAVAIYYLSKNKEAQKKLFEELKTLLPTKSDSIPSNYINSTPYLKACIKESQRLTPIAGANFRNTGTDLTIQGYKIPKDTQICIVNNLMCLDERQFPRPTEYIPERWLRDGDAALSAKNANPFAFLPFGFGPRMCAGRRFAEMELQVLLIKLFRNFEISYNYGEMEWKSELLTAPNKPLKFQVKDRSN